MLTLHGLLLVYSQTASPLAAMPPRAYKATPFNSRALGRARYLSQNKGGYRRPYSAPLTSFRKGAGRGRVSLSSRGFVGTVADAKFLDRANDTFENNTTGQITHISIVPQGVSVNQRIGKAFRCTSINVRGAFTTTGAAVRPAWANYLVWDYQPNKALPAITDILTSANPGAFPVRENALRFKIVKKWSGIAVASTETSAVRFDDYVKLAPDMSVLLTSADTTGVIGDVINGALYFVSTGDVAAAGTDAATNIAFRLNFTDN